MLRYTGLISILPATGLSITPEIDVAGVKLVVAETTVPDAVAGWLKLLTPV